MNKRAPGAAAAGGKGVAVGLHDALDATVPVRLDVRLLAAEPDGLVVGVGVGEADIDGLADAAAVPVTLSDALAVAVNATELLADEEPLVDALGSTLPVTELVEETDHETDFDGEIDGEGGAQKRSTAPGCQATTAPICAGVSAHEKMRKSAMGASAANVRPT